MKYPRLITAAILLLTFACISSIQQEIFRRVVVLNPAETFKAAFAEVQTEETNISVCSIQDVQPRCSETKKEREIKKKVVCFGRINQLTSPC